MHRVSVADMLETRVLVLTLKQSVQVCMNLTERTVRTRHQSIIDRHNTKFFVLIANHWQSEDDKPTLKTARHTMECVSKCGSVRLRWNL